MEKEKKRLLQLYGFEFPESFFKFYEFSRRVSENTFKGSKGIMNITPGKAFEVFRKNIPKNFNPAFTERYYHDPPEFFTILHGHTDGLHWGYYLDDPNNIEDLSVASYYAQDAFCLLPEGRSIFEAVRMELERIAACMEEDKEDKKHNQEAAKRNLEVLDELRLVLQEYETGERSERSWAYCQKYLSERKNIAGTRCKMGIMVPQESYKSIKEFKLFEKWNYYPSGPESERVFQKAMRALKDGYPGTALKAGKDLWSYDEYFELAFKLLDAAYLKLNRDLLRKSLSYAREYRRHYDRI